MFSTGLQTLLCSVGMFENRMGCDCGLYPGYFVLVSEYAMDGPIISGGGWKAGKGVYFTVYH